MISDLPDTDHATSKVGKDRDRHGEALVDIALGNGEMQLYFATVRRSRLILEVVARHLRAVDPLVKNQSRRPFPSISMVWSYVSPQMP